jgi:hypothetical protein
MERRDNSNQYVNDTIEFKSDFIQLKDRADPFLPELIDRLKQNGIRINYYGTNSADKLKQLFATGIDLPLVDDLISMMKAANEIGIEPITPLFGEKMTRYLIKSPLQIFLAIFVFFSGSHAGDRKFKDINKFNMIEARQGVAVDQDHIYVIGSQRIGKYKKTTGEVVAQWEETENGPIIHLNSGVIIEGKLYCAHSNYPAVPMTSSIEIWDAETLEHIGSHSFGIRWGSCTWVDRFDGYWWAAFAHYEKWKSVTGKGTEWTTVVQLDDQWQPLQAWVFPEAVVERMRPMSNSGGSWGPDGLLYCTGHDHPEIYAFRIPQRGSVLELVETIPINILGQGIAWDRSKAGFIYGIRKKDKQVILSELIENK